MGKKFWKKNGGSFQNQLNFGTQIAIAFIWYMFFLEHVVNICDFHKKTTIYGNRVPENID